jgi:hypothetical protein
MSEARAIVLIAIGMVLLMTISVLLMAALGIDGVALSLGAIIPAALAAYGVGLVVSRCGESGDGHCESRSGRLPGDRAAAP